jgi:hypothetical protein
VLMRLARLLLADGTQGPCSLFQRKEHPAWLPDTQRRAPRLKFDHPVKKLPASRNQTARGC